MNDTQIALVADDVLPQEEPTKSHRLPAPVEEYQEETVVTDLMPDTYTEPTAAEATRMGLNFALGGAGLLATIAVLIGPFVGIIFVIAGVLNKDPKQQSKLAKTGCIIAVAPLAVIVLILIAFAIVNGVLA